jgi:hypothetical protein
MVADYQADGKSQGRIAFVNIWEAVAKVRAAKGADRVLLPDGSHPAEEGYKVIVDADATEVGGHLRFALRRGAVQTRLQRAMAKRMDTGYFSRA